MLFVCSLFSSQLAIFLTLKKIQKKVLAPGSRQFFFLEKKLSANTQRPTSPICFTRVNPWPFFSGIEDDLQAQGRFGIQSAAESSLLQIATHVVILHYGQTDFCKAYNGIVKSKKEHQTLVTITNYSQFIVLFSSPLLHSLLNTHLCYSFNIVLFLLSFWRVWL